MNIRNLNKQNIIALVVLLVGVGVAGYLVFGGSIDVPFQGSKVVAEVNGEEITRAELDSYVSQIEQVAGSQGQNSQLDNPDVRNQLEQRALDNIIAGVLLRQKAREAGFEVTESEVEDEYQSVISQSGGEEQLKQRLAEIGMSIEEFKKDLRGRLLAEKYIDSQKPEEGFSVTDEEISSFYERAGGGQEGVPPLTEVQSRVEDQLLRQKENQFVQSLVSGLRSEADINIML